MPGFCLCLDFAYQGMPELLPMPGFVPVPALCLCLDFTYAWIVPVSAICLCLDFAYGWICCTCICLLLSTSAGVT